MKQPGTYNDVARAIENFAPLTLQEPYDNSGLLIGEPTTPVHGVLISLDTSLEAIQEAIALRCNLIVSHHPAIFQGIKTLRGDNTTSRIVLEAIRNGIGLIAAHTNLDSASKGVSYALGQLLGVENLHPLAPKMQRQYKIVTFVPETHAQALRQALFAAGAGHIGGYANCSYNSEGFGTYLTPLDGQPFIGQAGQLSQTQEIRIETLTNEDHLSAVIRALKSTHPYEVPAYDIYPLAEEPANTGLGAIGELATPVSENEFLHLVSERLAVPCLRHSHPLGKPIRRVALCGGSGSEFIPTAMQLGADAYITADCKYHHFADPAGRMLLIDAGHRETEMVAVEILYDIIRKNFPTFALHKSTRDLNPVEYYMSNH